MQSKSEICQKNLKKSSKMEIFKQVYSINFDKRDHQKIVYVIYHYTGMVNENKALQRLRE